jgi:histidinol-phosphate aminotransferase
MSSNKSDLDRFFRDDVVRMAAYVPGEQPQAGKYIKLNTNENPYPPSPKVVQAIVQAAQDRLERYPDPLGTSFRMAAADVYGLTPEHFLCGNGSDDILTIVTRAFVPTGCCVRFPYPSYILYRTLAQLQGSSWQEIPFQPDYSLGEDFTSNTDLVRLVYLPNPNSPTGTILSPDAILTLAEALPCPLLVDEAYADFADCNCVELVKQNPKIMVSRTLSKSYALAGLRFGFLIAAPEVVQMLRKVKDSYNCDALAIAGATAAVGDQEWLSQNRAKVIATRDRMTQRARGMGFDVVDSHANFIWCTRRDRAVQPLYQALKEQKVLVRYMNYPGWGDGLRISVGTDPQMDAAFQILESLL